MRDDTELHCDEHFYVKAYSFLKGITERGSDCKWLILYSEKRHLGVIVIKDPRIMHIVVISQSQNGHDNHQLCVTMVKEDYKSGLKAQRYSVKTGTEVVGSLSIQR